MQVNFDTDYPEYRDMLAGMQLGATGESWVQDGDQADLHVQKIRTYCQMWTVHRAMAFQSRPTSSRVMTKFKKFDYNGPYDRTMLEEAGKTLAQIISDRNSIIWEKIKMKSGVYCNNKRGMNIEWGEASTRYSHADQPEYLNNMEPYHRHKNANVTTLLSPCVKKTSGKRCSQSTATVTSDMAMTVTVTRDLVIQPGNDNNEKAKLNHIDTDVAKVVQINDQRKFLKEKDEENNRQTLQQVELNDKMTVPQEININVDLYEPNLVSDGLEIVRVQANNKSAVKDEEISERENKTVNNVTSRHVKPVDTILDHSCKFVFKCDFCDLQYADNDEMYKHLKNSVHFSASTYESSSDSRRLVLKQTMSVVNDIAMYKTILAICPFPKCNRISSNIHDCATHYYKCHGKKRNTGYKYGLAEVVLEESVENPIYPLICKSCGTVFEKRSKLNMHYKKNVGHYPYDTMHGDPMLYFCICCFNVYATFADITAHQSLVHAREVVSGILHFTVFHYTQIITKTYEGKEEENTLIRNTGSIKRKMLENDNDLLDEPAPKVIIRASNIGQINAAHASKNGVSTVDISNLTENRISSDDCPHFFIDRTPLDMVNMVSISHSTNNNADVVIDIEEEDDEQKCLDISSLRQIYKCDYCSTISENKLHMHEHLKVKNHRSASTVFIDCNRRVIYLKQCCSLIGNLKGIVSIVATCPDNNCNLLFSSIYTCSEHYTVIHNRLSAAMYGLASVQHSMLLSYNLFEYKCQFCGLEYSQAKDLNSHLKKNGHFPYVDREDCITYFFCLFCEKSFQSYTWITAHLFMKHQKLSKDGTLDLMVLFVSQNKVTKKHPLYPPGKDGEIRSIKHKIVFLKELKKNAAKKGKKSIRKEIKNLKRLL